MHGSWRVDARTDGPTNYHLGYVAKNMRLPNLSGKHAFHEFKWLLHEFKWLFFKWLYFQVAIFLSG